jgi:hypothetical protein
VKEDGGKKVDGGSDLQNSRGIAIVSAFPPSIFYRASFLPCTVSALAENLLPFR